MQTTERQPELPFFSPVLDEIKEGIQEEEIPEQPEVDSLLEEDADQYYLLRQQHGT